MNHLRILKLLNLAMGALTALCGILFLAMFVIPGLLACNDGEQMGAVFIISGIAVTALLVGLGLAHALAGNLVAVGRGRALQTALAVMQVSTFPVGTAYAIYALWVCWLNERTKKAFESALRPYLS
jgi:hypothetical protein